MSQQRDMSGALFVNDRKQQENHPDYQGEARINGNDFYISAWKKKGTKGTFLSIAFKPKQQKAESRQPSRDDAGFGDSFP